jgi:hypothetical protein
MNVVVFAFLVALFSAFYDDTLKEDASISFINNTKSISSAFEIMYN